MPPLLILAVVRLWLLWLEKESGQSLTSPLTFVRWDSRHYLDIARRGYELVPCNRSEQIVTEWCGNAGWYPGYPLLIRALSKLPYQEALIADGIALFFHIAAVLLIWNRFLERKVTLRNLLTLLMFNLGAGAIYLDAAFPVSAVLFFILLCIDRVAAGAVVTGAIAGVAAGILYPTSWVLAPVLLIWLTVRYRQSTVASGGWRILLPPAGVAVGHVIAAAVIHADTHAWDGYTKVQAKYGHEPSNPFRTLRTLLQPSEWKTPHGVPAIQTAMLAGLMIFVTLGLWRARRHTRGAASLLWFYAVAAWLFPLSLGPNLTFTRAEALVLPGMILLAELPAPVTLVLLGVAVWVFRVIALGFFAATIV